MFASSKARNVGAKRKHSWDEFPSVDCSHFLPGHKVEIHEAIPIQYDSNPRRQFHLWIDEGEMIRVLWIDHPLREMLLCDHDEKSDCDCKKVVRRYMESDPPQTTGRVSRRNG